MSVGVSDGDGGGDENRSMAVCQWALVMGMEVVMRITPLGTERSAAASTCVASGHVRHTLSASVPLG